MTTTAVRQQSAHQARGSRWLEPTIAEGFFLNLARLRPTAKKYIKAKAASNTAPTIKIKVVTIAEFSSAGRYNLRPRRYRHERRLALGSAVIVPHARAARRLTPNWSARDDITTARSISGAPATKPGASPPTSPSCWCCCGGRPTAHRSSGRLHRQGSRRAGAPVENWP